VEDTLKGIHGGGKKPDLVMLPEIWGTGFFKFAEYAAEGEPAGNGETFSRLAPWAETLGSYVLTGSFVEQDGGSLYNTSLLISPEGKVIGRYRKIHLFGYQSEERKILSPGEEVCAVSTGLGIWGLTTCYDLRFPELYRKLVDQGAEVFLIVSAWPMARLEHWKLFNQVRALENQVYLVSCNCAGTQAGHQFAGHSMAVSPWGEILTIGGDKEEILWSSFDAAKVHEFRHTFPVLRDRRLG